MDYARWKPIAVVEYDDVRVKIFRGRMDTVNTVKQMSDRDLMIVYRILTNDNQPITNIYPVYKVVAGQVDADWHEINGLRLSETMSENQRRRVTKAAAEANDAEVANDGASAAPKAPRKTIKTLICSRLIEAVDNPAITDETITAEIVADFPDSKAAANPKQHIAYYRSALSTEGKIPKVERAKREPKAKKTKVAGEQVEEVTVETA